MFEYANYGILFIGGFSIFGILFIMVLITGKAQHEGKKSYASTWGTIVLMICIWMMIDEGTSSKEVALASYEQFEKQGEIICSSLGKNYIVSKIRGWQRYKDGFTKDDVLLNVRQCRVEE